MEHIKGLIEAILLADSSSSSLPKSEMADRRPAIEAQNLVYQYRIYEATEAALLLERIASGQSNIADHGFPEIGSGFIKNV